ILRGQCVAARRCADGDPDRARSHPTASVRGPGEAARSSSETRSWDVQSRPSEMGENPKKLTFECGKIRPRTVARRPPANARPNLEPPCSSHAKRGGKHGFL